MSLTLKVLVEKFCVLCRVESASLSVDSDPQPSWVDHTEAYAVNVEQGFHFVELGPFLGERGAKVLKDPDRLATERDVPVLLGPQKHALFMNILVKTDDKGTAAF